MSKRRSKEIQEASEVEEAPAPEKFSRSKYLSSGSTMLNLALTDNPFGAFRKGCYYYLVGDSSSGKTFLSLGCLAEAAMSPVFKDHRFIFDDVENGALMDMEKFFGKKMAERLEAPRVVAKENVFSSTIEDFYFHIDDAIQDGRPFIYVLDSMDCLTSEKESEEFSANKTLVRKGKAQEGSYGDGKAKKNSTGMRTLVNRLKKTDSILIVISQTRDNIGFGAQFNPKVRSGGHALKFYATCEIWSSIKGAINKTYRGSSRNVGKNIQIQTKKNRQTGREGKVETPIYPSYGIDDMEGCINFLVAEDHWEQSGQKIKAPELKFEGTLKKLLEMIDKEGLENQVRKITGKIWCDIRDACAHQRKKRYE
jgi:RecA/RadA recombinase